MTVLLSENITLRDGRKDLTPSQTEEINGGSLGTSQVLSNELTSRLTEDDVDLLESLVLGFGHEGDLVEPSTAVVISISFFVWEKGRRELTQQQYHHRNLK